MWGSLVVALTGSLTTGCGRIGFDHISLSAPRAVDQQGGPGNRDGGLSPGDAGGTDQPVADAEVFPPEGDSGSASADAGLATPPVDAAAGDAGAPDAGPPDAGPPVDGGSQVDAAAGSDSGPGPTCADLTQNGDETGVDCGGSTCPACSPLSGNTPPVASMQVTPGLGYHDTASPTLFAASAAGTRDAEDMPGTLTYAWDWNNDGVFESGDVGSTPPGHSYTSGGTYLVILRVTDTGGLQGFAQFLVVVPDKTEQLVVTTDADEDDPAATPGSPGGTGLSLREAIKHANATPGRQSILIPAGFVIVLASTLVDSSDAAGLDIIGDDAVLDGSSLGGSTQCMRIDSDDNLHAGLEIRNCPAVPYFVTGSGNSFARGFVHDNGSGVVLGGSANTFGPDAEVAFNNDHGIELRGPNLVVSSRIHGHFSDGVFLPGAADGSVVVGNTIFDNGNGIRISNLSHNQTVVHNTLVDNTTGAAVGSNVNNTIFQNNISGHNSQSGILANADVFVTRDHNSFFANTSGDCNCSTYGTGTLFDDPLYVDRAADDYRLLPSSTLINAGALTGQDVNGPGQGSGDHNGSMPDIGAYEAP